MSVGGDPQGVSQLVLVRHSAPVVDWSLPADNWELGDAGRAGAHRLARFLPAECGSKIWSSSEVKARQTGEQIASHLDSAVGVDERLGEASRPVISDEATYKETVRAYLRGEDRSGWEPRSAVVNRFTNAVEDLLKTHDGKSLVLVTHGIAMTLYIEDVGAASNAFKGGINPGDFWTQLRLPDAWQIDLKRNSLDRIGFN